MVPAMTFSTPQNFFYSGGIWDLSWIDWIWANIAPERASSGRPAEARAPTTKRRELDGAERPDARHAAARSRSASCATSRRTTTTGCTIRRRIRSGTSPSCAASTAARARRCSTSRDGTTTTTGPKARPRTTWVSCRRAAAARSHALLLGPWVHGVDATARTTSGERDFGPDCRDRLRRGRPRLDGSPRPRRQATPGCGTRAVFRHGRQPLGDVEHLAARGAGSIYYFSAGRTGRAGRSPPPPAVEAPPSIFLSDPADPVINPYAVAGAHDYRALADARRADVRFAPLARDLEVTGPIRARVCTSRATAATQTCGCASSTSQPAGRAFNLMSPGVDAVRVSYRDLSRGRQLLEPGSDLPESGSTTW